MKVLVDENIPRKTVASLRAIWDTRSLILVVRKAKGLKMLCFGILPKSLTLCLSQQIKDLRDTEMRTALAFWLCDLDIPTGNGFINE